MKDYQTSLRPSTLFLHIMHVVITDNFSELDLSYEDSNEFLSKFRRARSIISSFWKGSDLMRSRSALNFYGDWLLSSVIH
jgi:hypothetical protein